MPYISLDKLSQYSKEEIYKHADFTSFTDTFRFRYDNYISFINENGLDSSFELIKTRQPSEFKYSVKDVQTFHSIIHTNIIDLNNMYEKFASKTRYFKLSYYKGMVHKFIKKLRLV